MPIIGVVDSGLGGLNLVHAIHDKNLAAHVIYVADMAYVPYGTKPMVEISNRIKIISEYLKRRGADIMVIACNTATVAIGDQTLAVPSIGIVDACVEAAKRATMNNRVLVMATNGTVDSHAYQKRLSELGMYFKTIKSSFLVDLVESEKSNTSESADTISSFLEPFKNQDLDTVILGCTHFTWLYNDIKNCMPNSTLVDGTKIIVESLERKFPKISKPSKNREPSLELLTTSNKHSLEKLKRFCRYKPSYSDTIVLE